MKKTSLFEKHIELNAKMVDFGGFNMPIQYSGISDEHINVRNNVGISEVRGICSGSESCTKMTDIELTDSSCP